MPTRGQKAAAEQAVLKESAFIGSQELADNAANPSPSDVTKTNKNGSAETIGSRLRKRRRTNSSAPEDSPPPSKRVQVKKSATKKGTATRTIEPSNAATQDRQEMPAENVYDTAQSSHLPHKTDGEGEIVGQRPSSRLAEGDGAHNFHAVIADIINHGETVDNHYATRSYGDISMMNNGNFQHISASFNLKAQSLPVLDNLATQILEIMAKSAYREILTIATKPDTDAGQAYATLKSLFDHTKKVYSVSEPFLNPYELALVETSQIDIIRKANMATFVSSVFGSQDVGFYHLNENFLDTFVADGSRLLKSQAQLFLELKTQAYISAVQNTERSREDILEDLFPHNLDEMLLKRRSGAKQLAPSEAEFTQRAQNRRRVLLEEATSSVSIEKLPDKYVWEAFLRDVSAYVSKNFEIIAGIAAQKSARPVRPAHVAVSEKPEQPQSHQGQPRSSLKENHQSARQQQRTDFGPRQAGSMQSVRASPSHASPSTTNQDDVAEKAAQAARYAMQDFSKTPVPMPQQQSSLPDESSMKVQPLSTSQEAMKESTPQIQYHFEHPLHPNVPAPPPPYYQSVPYQTSHQAQHQWNDVSPGQLHRSLGVQQGIPYPTQSAPTQVLYEQARMAATAKASPNHRRVGHPSQRRPWTTEEESSLMAGLDRVKGPHWSQILAMFGPGGTINEILKDRNQVQLKDKARNLKLFFLKSGIEVPYYLQFVTGELKTRAPAQAAKNEAKEKGTADEDRAHIEGLMALASRPSQDADQAMTTPVTQDETLLPNTHVPMADMGIGSQVKGDEYPIDPRVTSLAASGTKITGFSTEVAAGGMAGIGVPEQDLSKHRP